MQLICQHPIIDWMFEVRCFEVRCFKVRCFKVRCFKVRI